MSEFDASGGSSNARPASGAFDQDCKGTLHVVIENQIIPRLLNVLPMDSANAQAWSVDWPLGERPEFLAFTQLCLQNDAAQANRFVDGLMDRGLTPAQVFMELVTPAARHLGVLWDRDECDFTQVTCGLAIMHQMIYRLGYETPTAALNEGEQESVMLACAPGSQHFLGLTIVADLYQRQAIVPERPVAGLLLAGIIADTLNGTSPTATETDRRFLAELGEIAGISAGDLAAEIFAVGSPLQTMSPDKVVEADAKHYEEKGLRFSVAQIEEVTFANFDSQREHLLAALRERVGSEGLFFAALLVTDINEQNSYLLVEGNSDFLRTITYPEQSDHVWFLEGVVSRKKQLLPYLTECLARVR